MGRRILWNRKQWTDFYSGECAAAGHRPIPCLEHDCLIEEGIAHHARLANSEEVTASTQAWIDRNTRPGEKRDIAQPYVPDPKPGCTSE